MRYILAIVEILFCAGSALGHPATVLRAPAPTIVEEEAPRRTIVRSPSTTVEIPGQDTIIEELPPRIVRTQRTVVVEEAPRIIRRAPVFEVFEPVYAAPVFVESVYAVPGIFAAPAAAPYGFRASVRRGLFFPRRTVERLTIF